MPSEARRAGPKPYSTERDGFLAHGDVLQEIVIEVVAEAGLVADRDGAVRRGFDGGHDDVALPVALAGRDVAGQHEIRQRGERDVVRAADARFEHAAAPDRNAGGLRDIVHALRFARIRPRGPA